MSTSVRDQARLTGRLTLLVVSMRAGGARVRLAEFLAARRGLGEVDRSEPEEAYLALRASLCSRREDLAVFDAAFAEWFGSPPSRPGRGRSSCERRTSPGIPPRRHPRRGG